MVVQSKFHGVIPPIPTILYKDGTLDENGMKRLIDFLIESKVHGLFFNGSGGEFSQMTVEMRKKLAEFAVKYVNGRVPVLIGTGALGTMETVSLTRHAIEIGADGVVIINPYYWSMSEEVLFHHYRTVAEIANIPIIIYNFPTLTGQNLSPELVYKLAMNHSNIVGIKDTIEDVSHIRDILLKVKENRPDFSVFAGFDDHLLQTLVNGGDGSIPLTSSFVPELSVGIYEAYKSGNYEEAIKLHKRLSPILQLYQLETPFINVAKEAIKLRGIEISTEMLAPLQQLSNEKKEVLAKQLSTLLPEIY